MDLALRLAKLERSLPKFATPDDKSQWIAEPVILVGILLEQSHGTTANFCPGKYKYANGLFAITTGCIVKIPSSKPQFWQKSHKLFWQSQPSRTRGATDFDSAGRD